MVDKLKTKHRMLLESTKFPALETPSAMNNMAILIENQNNEVHRLMTESTAVDVATYVPILVPLVRRIYPNLVANHIAGVQALSAPQGMLFAMTARYTGDGTTNGHISPANRAQILVVKGDNISTNLTVGTSITGETNTKAKGKVKYVEGNNILVEFEDYDNKFAKGETFTNTAKYTVEDVFTNEALFYKVLKNYTGPLSTAEGEAQGLDMKEVGLTVESVSAEVKTRNLKGRYTVEMASDLKNVHGADAEKEIMDIMGKEIQLEIDQEIISEVNKSSLVLPDLDITNSSGRWDIEKLRTLTIRIASEAREIGRLTRRGVGNVLLVSPKVATALEQVGNFVLSPAKQGIDAAGSGLNPVLGTFDGKYKVVVDNYADHDYFNVIYKGSDKDAGVYFAPYLGLTFIRVVHPETGQPSIILKTRYDVVKNPLAPEMYSRYAVVNLGNIL